jgi:hypothetical protein
MRSMGELRKLDAQLAALARVEASLRLRLGQALEVLSRGGVFALGFSSLAAYALERCERSGRWVEGARCLARRIEPLSQLRRGVACGQVSWSMAELIARVAQPEEEARWLEAAASHTVREMRGLVRNAMASERAAGRDRAEANRAGGAESTAKSTTAAASAADKLPAAGNVSTSVADASASAADASAIEDEDEDDSEEMCTLVCTVDREEAWLFEATRHLLEHLGERDSNAQIEALLAEGQITLLAALPRGTLDVDASTRLDTKQQHGRELQRWRSAAEVRCEERVREAIRNGPGAGLNSSVGSQSQSAAALGLQPLEAVTARELDETVRTLCRALARHELELSQAALRFHRADGWRQLGYATEAQYARERLGISRSSFIARRSLASRLESLPQVAEALGTAQLGVEAALQVVRIATPLSQRAWVQRARQRTIKHLREDVAAALTAVRLSGTLNCPPPEGEEIDRFCELERAVVSGTVCRGAAGSPSAVPVDGAPPAEMSNGVSSAPGSSAPGSSAPGSSAPGSSAPGSSAAAPRTARGEGAVDRAVDGAATADPRYAWRAMLQSLSQWLERGLESVQMSAAPAAEAATAPAASRSIATAGRVRLRLRLTRSTYTWWRGLEAQARRRLPRGMSWLKFLCLSLWRGWQHLLGTDVAYGQIYLRDRYRCTSPVCSRQDVTPHHLKFRSAGGGDEDDNVAAVCTWCHLCGIHGGSIRAAGTAGNIHWELGAPNDPCLVVDGRERRAA